MKYKNKGKVKSACEVPSGVSGWSLFFYEIESKNQL